MIHPLVRKFAFACAVALIATGALAQQYPTRPVRMVVPSSPGGGTDVMGRNLAQKLTVALGQTVIVDNKPGADGVIGTDFVAKSPADGYTMLLAPSSHAVNPTLHLKMPFDTQRDLSCIMETAAQQLVLVVHPSLPVRNVQELIAYAKAHPGKLSFASSSNATQLPMELFNSMAGTTMINIPYKGTSPALTDLLSGRVEVAFAGAASVMPFIKDGKLRALAIGDDHRSTTAPDIPTVAESGLTGFQAVVWTALFVPSSTPRTIVTKVHDDLVKLMADNEFKEKLRNDGFEPLNNTPEECDAFINREIVKWAKVAKDAGIKAE